MPKKGDKFIIEIAEVVKWRESHGYEQEDYLVFPFGERLVNGIELKQLTPYNPDTDDAYQRGLNDAWDAARKIALDAKDGGISINELGEIFGTPYSYDIMAKFTPTEAIEKIRAYEEQKKADEEIKVGDEVETDYTGNVIIAEKPKDGWYVTIAKDFARYSIHESHIIKKTGRHFPQVAELLDAMRGDNDD